MTEAGTKGDHGRIDPVRLVALKLSVQSMGPVAVQGTTENLLRRAKEFEQYLQQAPSVAELPTPGQDAGNSPDAGPADLRPARPKLPGSSR
ncbi:MAG: hypothetical protein P4L83_21155 [Nevskia sp.]|nr:hypothetical protein [Nevskia sp.]